MLHSRIDDILTSEALADAAPHSSVLPCPAPDHKEQLTLFSTNQTW